MNFMKTVQKVKEVKTEEIILGKDTRQNYRIKVHTKYHMSDFYKNVQNFYE